MHNIRGNGHNVIEVCNLTKHFGNFTAVDNLSFDVPHGQIFGFLGPNGSGKTTTIRMLLGLLTPTSGTAIVLGNDVHKHALSIRARLGYMSQRFTLYDDLTVAENLRFYARSYGLRNRTLQERMNYILEIVDLKGREHMTPVELSGGWRQRLALGAAIMHEPALVFLDEPTAGVDPLSRRAFWDLLYAISAEGTTVFVTTHYMDEAEHCERLGFIYCGSLIAAGTPDEIKRLHVPGNIVQLTPTDPVDAQRLLLNAHKNGTLGESISVSLYGAQIHVLTHDGDNTRNQIIAIMDRARQKYSDIEIVPPSLEDAFIRLVQSHNPA